MNHFQYKDDELFVEDISVQSIVDEVGTPVYIYSQSTLSKHIKGYEDAFSKMNHITCYAMKANSNLAVLDIIGKNGLGVDIVSGGELYRALKSGIPANKIVYAGVGKTDEEIAYALAEGILMFNCESPGEVDRINLIAQKMNKKAPIALRVNPDIDANTHPYISTGLKKNKFGIPINLAKAEYIRAKNMEFIDIIGIHFHIGSQITELSPFNDSFKRINKLVEKLSQEGINIKYLDIGGGLGICYDNEKPPNPLELADILYPFAQKLDCCVISEPGRVILGNAGILVSRVISLKASMEKSFIIVDAGMNDLIRPSLYNAYHEILPILKTGDAEATYDIVGPICESGDFFAKDRLIKTPQIGDLLAVMSAGAYGFSMSSNYNSRPKSAEVMVDGENFRIIKQRETYEDLIRGECK